MTECIILAGGFGTRLKSYLPNLPKALAPINGSAFLDLLIYQLIAFKKISKIILALGYKSEMIKNHCRNQPYAKIVPIVFSEEKEPLGTGGALKQALTVCQNSNVLVLNGDSYLHFDFADLLTSHLEKKAEITIGYTYLKDTSRYGRIILDTNSQRIVAFKEKALNSNPVPGFINGGVYLVQKKIFSNLPLKDRFSLEKDGFKLLLKKQKIFGFLCTGKFIDIGTKESYLKSQEILANI